MASTIVSPYVPSVMIYGPVKSGKSGELINAYSSIIASGISRDKILVVKHEKEDSSDLIVSENRKLIAQVVKSSEEISKLINSKITFVFISGVHFFEDDIDELVKSIIYSQRKVIMSGIPTNYQGKPFNKMPELMALSRSLVHLKGLCWNCGSRQANWSVYYNYVPRSSCFKHHINTKEIINPFFIKNQPRLELILGPMFSEKTVTLQNLAHPLIQKAKIDPLSEKDFALFKWSKDNRYSKTKIISHNGIDVDAINVKDINQIKSFLSKHQKVQNVFIDEGQFFEGIYDFVFDLYKKGYSIYISALARDFRGEPFGEIPKLMTIADKITTRFAYCNRDAKRGHLIPATETQREIVKNKVRKASSYDDPVVVVGGQDFYSASCFEHHTVLNRPNPKYNLPELVF